DVMPQIRTTPRRYDYKTISVNSANADGISVLNLRRLLGISTRDTINSYLKALGYFSPKKEQKILGWGQVREVLALHLWLKLGVEKALGKQTHTHFTYIALKNAGLAEQALSLEGIDLEKQFQELKNEYQQRTSTSKF
ncbi:hypothetical protein, partial [Aerosakkonema funiforme]|uniref:hypothetical protein n=1 Tax=Aerosakkonema funiforme TaxID=1246630 RepID=UPI0035B8CE4D